MGDWRWNKFSEEEALGVGNWLEEFHPEDLVWSCVCRASRLSQCGLCLERLGHGDVHGYCGRQLMLCFPEGRTAQKLGMLKLQKVSRASALSLSVGASKGDVIIWTWEIVLYSWVTDHAPWRARCDLVLIQNHKQGVCPVFFRLYPSTPGVFMNSLLMMPGPRSHMQCFSPSGAGLHHHPHSCIISPLTDDSWARVRVWAEL